MLRHLGMRLQFLLLSSLIFLINNSTAWAQAQPSAHNASGGFHRRVTLEGNIHPMARAEFDRGIGERRAADAAHAAALEAQRCATSGAVHFDGAATRQELAKLSRVANAARVWREFGPADADIQAITDWLTSQGFPSTRIYSGRTVIEFSGNAGQVQQAFGTEIRKYEVDGKSYLANAQNPQIPAALAPVVAGIVSLNNFPRVSHAHYRGIARKIAGHAGLQPLYTFPRPNGTRRFLRLGPGDFATIYNSKQPDQRRQRRDGPDHRHRRRNQHQCARCNGLPIDVWPAGKFQRHQYHFEWRRSGYHFQGGKKAKRIWMFSGPEQPRPVPQSNSWSRPPPLHPQELISRRFTSLITIWRT